MSTFPMTTIGGIEVSRVCCGTNPFNGISHFSHARDMHMKEYYSVEHVVEVLEACRQEGINAIVGPAWESNYQMIHEHERQTGYHWVWICTPSGRTAKDVLPGVKWCADHGVSICLPHPDYTDSNLLIAENRIVGVEEILTTIRDCGMVPGLSTHRPETIVISDKVGYDVETYILPFNSAGFLCPVETDWTTRVIRDTPKPMVCIKPLAAGRLMPPTGLSFVLNNNKPIDTVAIGFLGAVEAKEDIGIARDIIERRQAEVELTYSRSKAVLAQKTTT